MQAVMHDFTIERHNITITLSHGDLTMYIWFGTLQKTASLNYSEIILKSRTPSLIMLGLLSNCLMLLVSTS
jgi:hypothetical protein